MAKLKAARGVNEDIELEAEDLRELVTRYKKVFETHYGEPFPERPRDQLRKAILAVFSSWSNPRAVAYRRINKVSSPPPPPMCVCVVGPPVARGPPVPLSDSAASHRSRASSAPPSTSSPWPTATWATPAARGSSSPATRRRARTPSTASTSSTRRGRTWWLAFGRRSPSTLSSAFRPLPWDRGGRALTRRSQDRDAVRVRGARQRGKAARAAHEERAGALRGRAPARVGRGGRPRPRSPSPLHAGRTASSRSRRVGSSSSRPGTGSGRVAQP